MLSNVFVFTGNAFLIDLLKREWVDRFAQKHGAEGVMRFDVEEEGQTEALRTELTTTSMFANKKMLLVRGNPFTNGTKKSRSKKIVASSGSPLLSALEAAGEDTIVVFLATDPAAVYPSEIPPQNIKTLSAQGGRVHGYSAGKDLSHEDFFIHLFSSDLSVNTIREAARAVTAGTKKKEEPDLFSLYHALSQLSSLPKEKQDRLSLHALLHIEPEEQGYELVTFFLSSRTIEAVRTLSALLRQGMHPRQVFRMVCTQALFLLRLKALSEDKMSTEQMAEHAGRPVWIIQKSLPPLRSLSFRSLQALVHTLTEVNLAMNAGELNAERPDEFQRFLVAAIVRSGVINGARAASRMLSRG